MTGPGSNWPPDGFQWVDQPGGSVPSGQPLPGWPANQPPTRQPGKPRRRPWLLLGALVLTVVIVVGGIVVWRSLGTNARITGQVGAPQDLLISFPLEQRPKPGWRLTTADIGLPPDVTVGELFASTKDKAYFIANKVGERGERSVGWVYGVDIHTGKMLFPPIELADFRGSSLGDCYTNGPGVAVCLTTGDVEQNLPRLVWVIDLDRGQVTFSGPTDMSPADDGTAQYVVRAIGNFRGETRLVAIRKDEGVYGIGPMAERTWFVPGSGAVFDPDFLKPRDIPPLTLAMQGPPVDDPNGPYKVFSVVDGTDLTPTPPDGLIIRKALVYNGGFAYSFHESGKPDGLLFYDTDGKLVGRYQNEKGDLTPIEDPAVPLARMQTAPEEWQVFTAAGEPVLSFPSKAVGVSFRVIGTKIYVDDGTTDDRWQQWNLESGESGPVCGYNLEDDYVGSDGTLILVGPGLESDAARAIDPANCATKWEITEAETDKSLQLWKVGTGLLQRTRNELTQLVGSN